MVESQGAEINAFHIAGCCWWTMPILEALKATGHKIGIKDNGVFWMDWEEPNPQIDR